MKDTKWRRMGGTIGDCRIIDLHYRGFELESKDWPQYDGWINFFDGLDLSGQTPEQVIETIIARCHEHSVTVEPGETFIDADGKWTFLGWRMTKV